MPKSTMWTLAWETETWAAANWNFRARTSSRSRTEPSVTTPTQPRARWILACTSPHWAPWPRGSSRSWTTMTRGAGMLSTKSHQPQVLARCPSLGPCSARMMQVAAYPTRGPSSGKRPRISEETLPTSRGRILNVSMALATLGLVILVRASICWLVSGTGGPPWGTVECLDGALALLDEHLLELFDHGFDLREVGIDLEGPLEVREGLLGLAEPEIDLAVAAEHAPVLRVALHDLVAVPERFLVLSRQEIDGGALVPTFRGVEAGAGGLGRGLAGCW